MAFILALLVGIAVIAGLMVYWAVMLTLFVGGLILAFWILVFTYFLSDKPELAVVGVIVATGVSIWLMANYGDKTK
jgi:membrane protein implicated in regulation of membrane protease activity